ncbi:MAG: putative membrane protein, YraQ family [Candidatus Methanosuratincola subterraneus]|uniref:Putative membrane protein, YraQ family n=1 Tax=Methanosuratincola subterraneus TaxID=2593994 RepID=A0A444L5G7_METS7|nr:MAG: putative membrane protein, YraQ family [Candidatus Methanosuratincola subterraneus]
MPLDQFTLLLMAGLQSLIDYVAQHTVTCLVPAFFIAGAMNYFISKDVVIRYLGYSARRLTSFPLATVSSIGLAVCSCTVIPIASGLYRRGSSIGPAFIFLWTAPALNILTITYSGAILGVEITLVRILAAISTSFIIGLVMVTVFRRDEQERSEKERSKPNVAATKAEVLHSKNSLILILMLVATLLLPNYLGAGRTFVEKLLIFLPLFVASMAFAYLRFSKDEILQWFQETWWFVKKILPLLLVGVFIVGVVGAIIPPEFVQQVLGGNGLPQTFLANLIGALMYFSSMTESPFVKMMMGLGMGKAPALALLLTGPGMSLPSMLAIIRVFTFRKAIVYILTTVVVSTISAFIFGNLLL